MQKRYSARAFYAELLVVLAVFSVCCVLLAGVFRSALEMAQGTREKTFAAAEAGNLLEMAKANGLAGFTWGETPETGRREFYYDENWQPAEKPQAVYRIILREDVEQTSAGRLYRYTALAERCPPFADLFAAPQPLAQMQAVCYRPEWNEGVAQ